MMNYEKWLQLKNETTKVKLTQFIFNIQDVGIASTDGVSVHIVKTGFYDIEKYPIDKWYFETSYSIKQNSKIDEITFYPIEMVKLFVNNNKYFEYNHHEVEVKQLKQAVKISMDFQKTCKYHETCKITSGFVGDASKKQQLTIYTKVKEIGDVETTINTSNESVSIMNEFFVNPNLLYDALKGFDDSAVYTGKGKKRIFLHNKKVHLYFHKDFVKLENDERIAIVMRMDK